MAVVSPSFFRVAEVSPAFGRTFFADEHIPGFESEAVVSHAFAVAHFGAPTSAIGQGVALNSVGYRVIGVMPPSFRFPARTDIWVPRPPRRTSTAAFEGDLDVASFGQTLVGRLRHGVRLDEARAELKVMSRRLEDTNKKSGVGLGLGAVAIPLKQALSRESRPALLALSAAVLFVLLLTCVNAANLVLAHAVTREKELAIYIWLGASPARLFQQLLAESLLLALGAGVLGVLIAIVGIHLFSAYAPQEIPGLFQAGIDIRAVGFASALSLITAVAVGLAPALRTYVRDIAQGGASVANLKMALVLRVVSGSETLAPLIREAVASLDREVPLFSVRPLEEIVSSSAGPLRLRAVTLSLFATLALVLAAAGVYSVVSYSVARRTHEIGVRMSLGARRQDVLLQVIGEGARLGLVGVVLGTLASLEAGKLIASLLFGIAPNDPATLGAACLTLFLLTLIASAVPAFRAASVDPAISIRYE